MTIKLIQNNIFFVIPSWSALLGYPTLGKYVHHNVSTIEQDLVIFFGSHECAVPTERGVIYFLFGLGYYYTKFELQLGNYIIDNRQLTGLILADFVYDHLATSKNITLETDKDVIVNENLFKLPFDLSYKTETQKSFIQGTLMRNLFIPYKDIFLEFMDLLKQPQSYQIDNYGPMILSTHWNFYNKILISNIWDDELKGYYLQSTAGLSGISLGADQLLNSFFNRKQSQELNQTLKKLKSIYSNLTIDPMYLFSIIDNGFQNLKTQNLIPTNLRAPSKPRKKEPIFFSGEPYIDSFSAWPDAFSRKSKKQLEDSFIPEETVKFEPQINESSQEPQVKESSREESQFELRTQRRPFIEFKVLPTIPTSNVVDILMTLKEVVEKDYDIQSIGKALELAHKYIKSMVLHSNYLWDMSKFSNIYQRSEPNLGLSPKEKFELLESIEKWINLAKRD